MPLCLRTCTRSCSIADERNKIFMVTLHTHAIVQPNGENGSLMDHMERGIKTGHLLTFERLVADVAGVWLALLVSAGYMALQRTFLCKPLLAEFAAVWPLTCVCAVMLVQARYTHTNDRFSHSKHSQK